MPDDRPIYLDCNATTPLDPRVRDAMWPYFESEFGNAGSHTHIYGQKAATAVREARRQIASCLKIKPSEVIFTSGATESINLAILGVATAYAPSRHPHIVSTSIEHKAALEPLEHLESLGYEVTMIAPGSDGRIDAGDFLAAIKNETVLISIQHVNNETGVIQPIAEIADALDDHPAIIHVDAAQGFCKETSQLTHPRLDFISISSHKIYGPKGIGALIRRSAKRTEGLPKPIYFGGGQERGIRPGTLPVPLIVGFGKAADLLHSETKEWTNYCFSIRADLLRALEQDFAIRVNGNLSQSLPNTLNVSIEDFPSDAVMLQLKDIVAISNGSACTSDSPEPSHVMLAMGQTRKDAEQAVRFSWSHLTPPIPYQDITQALHAIK